MTWLTWVLDYTQWVYNDAVIIENCSNNCSGNM